MPLAPSLSIPPTITRQNDAGVHAERVANRDHDGACGYPGLVAGAAAPPRASQRVPTRFSSRPRRIDSRRTRANAGTDPPGVAFQDPRGSSIQEDSRLSAGLSGAIARSRGLRRSRPYEQPVPEPWHRRITRRFPDLRRRPPPRLGHSHHRPGLPELRFGAAPAPPLRHAYGLRDWGKTRAALRDIARSGKFRSISSSPLSTLKSERFGTDGQNLHEYDGVVSPGCSKFSSRSPKAPRARHRNRKQNQIPSEIPDRRKARIFGGFHEKSIPADGCTGPAGRAGVCTDSPGEHQYSPDHH